MKRRRSPLTHVYFAPRSMVISSLVIFLTKKAPNSKVTILCLEWQISIYIVAQKNRTYHFIPNHSQCQVHLIRKTILPPTACLASFFGRDNSVITLFQFTIICVQVNSKRMNGHTQYKNSHFVLYIITKQHNFM